MTILNRFNDYALYEILKRNDPDTFSGKFGYGFEKYIKNSLDTFNIKYFDDKYIKSILGKKQTNSDILIKEEHNNILLEVKSGEMYDLTLLNTSQDTFIKSLKNSIIKGYKQIIETAYLLSNKTKISSQFFGMIITYKNLLLGSPDTIWHEFMKEIIMNDIPDIYKESQISYENIFCISLEEFEMLLITIKKEKISLSDFLDKVSIGDKKLFFMNFDYNNIDLSSLKHIKNKTEEIFSRLDTALRL